MPRPFKIVLLAVCACVAVLMLVASAMLWLVDTDAYKQQLQAAAAAATGLDVSIDGRLRLGLFPDAHVTLERVRLRNGEKEIATMAEAVFGFELKALLNREIGIGSIRLRQPRIALVRNPDGSLNLPVPAPSGDAPRGIELANITLDDATLTYTDNGSGAIYVAENCTLDMPRLEIAGSKDSKLTANLSMAAELACGNIRSGEYMATDLRLSAAAKDGVFALDPVALRVFGAQGTGSIRADFSGAVPYYRVIHSLPQFDIAEVFKARTEQKLSEGAMDFAADLTLRGNSAADLRRSLDGQVSLRGENLVFHGSDIDREIARIKSSQRFSLVDAGAFMFAGPFGLAITKGYDFANVLQGSGGSSDIRLLVSDWKFQNGVAQARDVAMATDANRIAIRGRIDFVRGHFDDVTVALLDNTGCAIMQQKIEGSFQKPVVAQASMLQAIAGPAIGLLKKGKALFIDEKCEVFYSGSVAPPR